MKEKKCIKCGEKLVIGVNWYDSCVSKCFYICKKCHYNINEEYYKEYGKEYSKEYYKKNKEKCDRNTKLWRIKNREKYNEKQNKYYKKQNELFKKEVSEEDKQFIKEHLIDRDELYNKVMKQIK